MFSSPRILETYSHSPFSPTNNSKIQNITSLRKGQFDFDKSKNNGKHDFIRHSLFTPRA